MTTPSNDLPFADTAAGDKARAVTAVAAANRDLTNPPSTIGLGWGAVCLILGGVVMAEGGTKTDAEALESVFVEQDQARSFAEGLEQLTAARDFVRTRIAMRAKPGSYE